MSSAKQNTQRTRGDASSSGVDEACACSARRMQQFLHGLRLAAADDMAPANDLERLATLLDFSRRQSRDENSEQRCA
ncbi:MAG: hypothetical protein ABI439_11350 [Rhodospirillales bacterium]